MVTALRGKHGWLFLAGDRNQVLRQHSGDLLFSDADLRKWRETVEARQAWLRERGIPYHFLVAPNKESVYSEELPDLTISNGLRPIIQLGDYLNRAGSPFSFIYPLAELQAEKKRSAVYHKTDTHWNALGAFVAYRRLAEEVKKTAPIRVLARDEVRFYEHEHLVEGDLGSKLDPPEKSVRLRRLVQDHRARLISDNGVSNNGRLIVLESRDLEGTTCVMFGDSFGLRLLTYLAESFGRLVFAYRNTFDPSLVEREQPVVVISQSVERFLIEVPEDVGALSAEDLERRKRRLGGLMPVVRVEAFAAHFRSRDPSQSTLNDA